MWAAGTAGVFAPLLIMLGLSGKRHTDRLTVDLARQMSFARAGRIYRELAGTTATAGQVHNAVADTAALLTGEARRGRHARAAHPAPDVVLLNGTGAPSLAHDRRLPP
jgi:hypothetical protein